MPDNPALERTSGSSGVEGVEGPVIEEIRSSRAVSRSTRSANTSAVAGEGPSTRGTLGGGAGSVSIVEEDGVRREVE